MNSSTRKIAEMMIQRSTLMVGDRSVGKTRKRRPARRALRPPA